MNIIIPMAGKPIVPRLVEDIGKDVWVQKVANPSAFGVVRLNEEEQITDFVEKPREFISDLAIKSVSATLSGMSC